MHVLEGRATAPTSIALGTPALEIPPKRGGGLERFHARGFVSKINLPPFPTQNQALNLGGRTTAVLIPEPGPAGGPGTLDPRPDASSFRMPGGERTKYENKWAESEPSIVIDQKGAPNRQH